MLNVLFGRGIFVWLVLPLLGLKAGQPQKGWFVSLNLHFGISFSPPGSVNTYFVGGWVGLVRW